MATERLTGQGHSSPACQTKLFTLEINAVKNVNRNPCACHSLNKSFIKTPFVYRKLEKFSTEIFEISFNRYSYLSLWYYTVNTMRLSPINSYWDESVVSVTAITFLTETHLRETSRNSWMVKRSIQAILSE